MSGELIDSLKDCIDSVLGVRDSIGAVLKPVSLVKRTWEGDRPGNGEASEEKTQVLPSPRIVALDKNLKAVEIGVVKSGDIEIRQVSKNQFPSIAEVDGSSPARNVEMLFEVGTDLYQVIKVSEHYLWWNIQLRRLTDQTRGTSNG
jgi:hypothetical protein